ncbi:GNAT family N-acetyltransferase [Spirosoma endophyticum]|uniref:N-acetyltransferase domain-containing protein n=1 Tax=Spirosoma endophyticum TaxID=662367 RepID=A0A1I2GHW5_9BACT|nr:GNAT family N-acetyltransferase [Spirosoma endophyticum]SFF16457.1 hypothetical protein SAMN05216167_13220 [Spirosoma endophyticum]
MEYTVYLDAHNTSNYQHRFVLADQHNVEKGFAGGMLTNNGGETFFYLEFILIKSEADRQSDSRLGTKLLKEVESFAKDNGMDYISGEFGNYELYKSPEEAEKALTNFYGKNGYQFRHFPNSIKFFKKIN